jgi:hypothetical protein
MNSVPPSSIEPNLSTQNCQSLTSAQRHPPERRMSALNQDGKAASKRLRSNNGKRNSMTTQLTDAQNFTQNWVRFAKFAPLPAKIFPQPSQAVTCAAIGFVFRAQPSVSVQEIWKNHPTCHCPDAPFGFVSQIPSDLRRPPNKKSRKKVQAVTIRRNFTSQYKAAIKCVTLHR